MDNSISKIDMRGRENICETVAY